MHKVHHWEAQVLNFPYTRVPNSGFPLPLQVHEAWKTFLKNDTVWSGCSGTTHFYIANRYVIKHQFYKQVLYYLCFLTRCKYALKKHEGGKSDLRPIPHSATSEYSFIQQILSGTYIGHAKGTKNMIVNNIDVVPIFLELAVQWGRWNLTE